MKSSPHRSMPLRKSICSQGAKPMLGERKEFAGDRGEPGTVQLGSAFPIPTASPAEEATSASGRGWGRKAAL